MFLQFSVKARHIILQLDNRYSACSVAGDLHVNIIEHKFNKCPRHSNVSNLSHSK